MSLRIQVLTLLILAQVWLSMPRFVFELRVKTNSVTTKSVCDYRGISECETYFSVFCLREGRVSSQSTDENDCPLGRNTERFNAYLGNQPNNIVRRIASQRPWPVMFIG